jgi:hypothetical protein
MTITDSIISDLLPIYYAGDCSSDTKTLVDDYFKSHPDFAKGAGSRVADIKSGNIPQPVFTDLEIAAVRRTRKVLRWRSTLMGLAIFFSCAPFSFFSNNTQTIWLLREAPGAAAIYGALGVVFWAWYFIVRRRTGGL